MIWWIGADVPEWECDADDVLQSDANHALQPIWSADRDFHAVSLICP